MQKAGDAGRPTSPARPCRCARLRISAVRRGSTRRRHRNIHCSGCSHWRGSNYRSVRGDQEACASRAEADGRCTRKSAASPADPSPHARHCRYASARTAVPSRRPPGFRSWTSSMTNAWFWDQQVLDFVAAHLHLVGQRRLSRSLRPMRPITIAKPPGAGPFDDGARIWLVGCDESRDRFGNLYRRV